VTNRDGNFEVYVMNADGSNQTNVTNNPADDRDADWQPFPGPKLPTSKDQCKKGGWQDFKDAEGERLFKNQGDCVSYVATGGKNPPSGPQSL
jgi:hypothetical protein